MFPGPQCQRQIVLWKRTENFAVVARNRAWNIDSYFGTMAYSQIVQYLCKLAFNRSREAVAEQTVDNNSIVEVGFGIHRAVKCRSRLTRRFGTRLFWRNDLNCIAFAMQDAGDDIAVATIVAGSAKDRDRPSRSHAHDPVGRALSGALHQFPFADPGRYCGVLGRTHFFDR